LLLRKKYFCSSFFLRTKIRSLFKGRKYIIYKRANIFDWTILRLKAHRLFIKRPFNNMIQCLASSY
jgi:hypothetical protein